MSNSENIFSSTGNLGVSFRQHQRLYVNGTNYADNPPEVIENFDRLITMQQKHPEKIGRCVYKSIVSKEVVQSVNQNGHRQNLEVSLDVSDFTDENSWLIYMAHNDPNRSRIEPQDKMIEATSKNKIMKISPEARITNLIEQGMSFVTQFDEKDIEDMATLWEGTFGWNHQEIKNLGHRIETNSKKDPQFRNLWFSAIKDKGQIVSLAMAEKITVPTLSGTMDLVESTEWRTNPNYTGKGLLTAVLASLNCQILEDCSPNTPLIYAECNFQSRSDRAGSGIGFVIPDRNHQELSAPQILVQNTEVEDGQTVPKDKLRDFTFMYLPKDTINKHYNKETRKNIISLLNK